MARILIVDDDPRARRLLVDLLEYEGYVVIECDSGAGALTAAERESPDLVISDFRMPDMSGKQFVEDLCRQPRLSHPPFIFHTAAGDEREIQEFAAVHGAAAILTKPCPAKVMLAAIASALSAPLPEPFPAPSERLRARIPAYVASCGADVEAIAVALAADDLAGIRHLSHNLKGTGSAYGFCHITHLGDRLETSARAGDRTEVAKWMRELAEYLGAIKAAKVEIGDRVAACAQCMTREKARQHS
jgi:CheY-like chemotaxis protein/HPt (histidine-containing phosphotransfer) domain-containing protein